MYFTLVLPHLLYFFVIFGNAQEGFIIILLFFILNQPCYKQIFVIFGGFPVVMLWPFFHLSLLALHAL